MLRKILTIAFILALVVTFGCKKKEAAPTMPAMPKIQKQVEGAGQEAAKQAESAKQEAGKELQKTGEELQKEAPAAK
jgi:hypothetical protein